MKSIHLPYIGAGLGTTLFLFILVGQTKIAADPTALLGILVACEFGFFLTLIASVIGIKQIRLVGFQPLYTIVTLINVLLVIRFLFYIVEFWPL